MTAALAGEPPLLQLEQVSRIYDMGRVQVAALRDVDLTIRAGELVAIVGPSGSGKTTLMNVIGCLDRPTSGTYRLGGQDVAALSGDDLAQVRGRNVGFVFQSYDLLPRTSALENVATPLLYQGVGRRDRRARAQAELERLGLGDRTDHHPNELSGGQQQRVGIARALVTDPPIILADEPTGNLDSQTSAHIVDLLDGLAHQRGRAVLIVTHDPQLAHRADRVLRLDDGRLAELDTDLSPAP